MKLNEPTGIVFNMQGYSVHDGPGIRTLVFLKGCPLRCEWCSNPESQLGKTEIGYNINKCLRCGRCVASCPEKVLKLTDKGIQINRELCTQCNACSEACPSKAIITYGSVMTAKEVLNKVEQDSAFYARSGGGMTLSGGEPFMQFDFFMALLEEANTRAIHTAVETAAWVKESHFLQGAALLDYMLCDVKHMDNDMHKKGTGKDNGLILQNIKNVRKQYPNLPLHIRTPLIPEFNDTEESIEAIACFAKDIGAIQYELLPFHRMGEQKYTYLDRISPTLGKKIEDTRLARLNKIVQKYYPEDSDADKYIAL